MFQQKPVKQHRRRHARQAVDSRSTSTRKSKGLQPRVQDENSDSTLVNNDAEGYYARDLKKSTPSPDQSVRGDSTPLASKTRDSSPALAVKFKPPSIPSSSTSSALSTKRPRREKPKRQKTKHFDRILSIVRTSPALYSALGVMQHTIALLKNNPRFVGSFGKLDVLMLQSSISDYRNFTDFKISFSQLDRAKLHRSTHRGKHHGDLYARLARALGGCQIFAHFTWAALDSLSYLTKGNVIKTSNAATPAVLFRTGHKFKLCSLSLTYLRLLAEEIADRKIIKTMMSRHRPRREWTTEQVEAELEEIEKRRKARIKAAITTTLWMPVSLAQFSLSSPLSIRWASRGTIGVHSWMLWNIWRLRRYVDLE